MKVEQWKGTVEWEAPGRGEGRCRAWLPLLCAASALRRVELQDNGSELPSLPVVCVVCVVCILSSSSSVPAADYRPKSR